jgi:hypothetical protein
VDHSQSPNVRYVEESYSETWPTATQYGSVQFGPVKEGQYVYLPMPLELHKLTVDAQWQYLLDPKYESARHNLYLNWNMRLTMERAQMASRLRSEVIQRVNEALSRGEIRNAVQRDPVTGRPRA